MVPFKLAKEDRLDIVGGVEHYVETEFGEHIGNLAAEALLDYVTQMIAPHIYNQAIADAKRTSLAQMERLDDELGLLERPLKRSR